MEDLKQTCNCENENCKCEENCSCGENCNCTEEENCGCMSHECNCGEVCKCEDTCECTDEINDCINHECSCEGKDKKKERKKKKDKNLDKLNEAYNMISTLEDKLLREKAEMVNYRRRKEEEQTRLLKFANEDLIKELLETVDNFERALNYDDEEAKEETKKFLSGFKMIYCNLVNILEKFEVKAIDEKNKPFDPMYHQAVMTEKVEGMEEGLVIDVLRKGYMLKDKVIRPAMVKVSE